MNHLKNPLFLLTLIITAFIFRGLFLAGVLPLFTGQDEARHYNTVQWLSVNQNISCQEEVQKNIQNKEDLSTYRFNEEIRQTSSTINLSVWRQENFTKTLYINGPIGVNEHLVKQNTWKKEHILCPPDIVPSNTDFFHWIASGIENLASDESILVRFYFIRFFTVILGALTVIFAYLATKVVGFSERIALLVALLTSLQPRLFVYTTNINYDTLLIPCFAVFFWAGLHFIKRGATVTSLLYLTIALVGALLTKGTGLVLIGGIIFLCAFTFFKKRNAWKGVLTYRWIVIFVLASAFMLFISITYNISSLFHTFSFPSLLEYLSKSLPRITSSSENFWGTISWNESNLGSWFVFLIWFIEAVALYGLMRYFYLKESLPFLPNKSVILFCITLILSLQLGVRFHDWNVFQQTGSLALGTPGRYFLPTLLPQLVLIAVGLGALLRQKLALERVLVVLAVIMLAFNFYTTWLIIIPRFYL